LVCRVFDTAQRKKIKVNETTDINTNVTGRDRLLEDDPEYRHVGAGLDVSENVQAEEERAAERTRVASEDAVLPLSGVFLAIRGHCFG